MTTEQTLAGTTEATDTSAQIQSQDTAAPKTYTQEEFDNHMAGLKASLTKKLLKPYEELGDVEELRELKAQAQKKAQDEQLKRGEFEKILQDMAAKKDAEIQRRDSIIKEYKVDSPLLNAAARYRSVNPEQVRSLLKNSVRMNEQGDVEVLDEAGQPRYNDQGHLLGVDDYVREWLDKNPHFVQATPATTSTKSSINNATTTVDVSKLDMKNPEHRKIYAEWRKTNGIR